MKRTVLYKYFSDKIDFFADRLIRFSPRSALNDPFEIRPSIESLAKYLHSTDDYHNKDYQDVFEMVKKDQKQYFHPYDGAPLFNALGVLSLTESKRNLLMWTHYANSHKGYVVGFDTTNDFFSNYRKTDKVAEHKLIGELLPVRYDSFRAQSVHDFTEWYFHKSDEWIYEKEHRVVFPLYSCDHVRQINSSNNEVIREITNHEEISQLENIGSAEYLCLFQVPKEAIVSVTFGANTDQSMKAKIIGETTCLNPFQFEKASYSNNRFELDITE